MAKYKRALWVIEVVEHGQWLPAFRDCQPGDDEGEKHIRASVENLKKHRVRARAQLYVPDKGQKEKV